MELEQIAVVGDTLYSTKSGQIAAIEALWHSSIVEFEQTVIFCDSQLVTLVVCHRLLMLSSLLSPSPCFSWLKKSSLLVSFALVNAKHCL